MAQLLNLNQQKPLGHLLHSVFSFPFHELFYQKLLQYLCLYPVVAVSFLDLFWLNFFRIAIWIVVCDLISVVFLFILDLVSN
jgi:hypothetical protein